MSLSPLRVGIVGASAERGWAKMAHVPAVQQLDGLVPTAVATSRRETARAAEVDGTRPPGTPFRFEIVGTEGTLELTGGHPAGFQGGRLELQSSLPAQPVSLAVSGALLDPAVNVSEMYAQLAADIRGGTRTVPDFSEAVRTTRLVDAVLQAAETGARRHIG